MVPVLMDSLQLCAGTAGLGAGQECTGFQFSSKHTHTHEQMHPKPIRRIWMFVCIPGVKFNTPLESCYTSGFYTLHTCS